MPPRPSTVSAPSPGAERKVSSPGLPVRESGNTAQPQPGDPYDPSPFNQQAHPQR